MTDIDWLAVDMVCTGTVVPLTKHERRAAIRRLSERMLKVGDWHCEGRNLTCTEVARRLRCTERTVLRDVRALPPAEKRVCPICRQPMWISLGTVEPHPDAIHVECPMSGRQMLSGLAAQRPDLYEWVMA